MGQKQSLQTQVEEICNSLRPVDISNQRYFVKSIFRDQQGFMWMGLIHSLVRYDGTSITRYNYHPTSAADMLLHGPEVIAEGHDGTIWIASWRDGVAYLPKNAGAFKRLQIDTVESRRENAVLPSSVLVDSDGVVWVTTRDFVLHRLEDQKVVSNYRCSIPNAVGHYNYGSMHFGHMIEDPEDADLLWIGSPYGITQFSKSKGAFTHFNIDKRVSHYYRPTPRPLYKDARGQIWFGHFNKEGLKVFNTHSEQWTHKIASATEHGISMGSNRIFGIYPYQDSLVIATTWWNHVIIAKIDDPSDHAIAAYTNATTNCQGFLVTSDNQIWIGMQDKVLLGRSPARPFGIFVLGQYVTPNDKNNWPSSMYYDSATGDYIFSTIGGDGIFVINHAAKTGEVIRYRSKPGVLNTDVSMRAIIPHNKDLWISSTGGMLVYDKKQKAIRPFRPDHEDADIIHQYHNSITTDSSGFWMALRSKGMAYYAFEHDVVLRHSNQRRTLLDSEKIIEIAQWKQDYVIAITPDRPHLYDLNSHTSVANWLQEDVLQKFERNGITHGLLQNDTLWITTRGNGLAKITLAGERPYPTEFHLSENAPAANQMNELYLSSTNELWIATSLGFSYFDQSTKSLLDFGVDDGVAFPGRAGWLGELTTGEICVTANRSYEFFDPAKLKRIAQPIQPYLKSMRVAGAPKPGPASTDHALVLTPSDDHITFEMGALNFNPNPNTFFKYRLDGYDKMWKSTGRDFVNYTNLPGGEYTFRFTASPNGSLWSEQEVVVPFRKRPQFIKSSAFYFLLALFLAGSAAISFFVIKKRRKRKDSMLEQESQLLFLQKERAEAELSALRAQMNPHFLFNSLNSINWYIVKNKPKEASRYLTRFSKLVRLILEHSKSELITLADEIDCLTMYVDLESMRFEESFTFRVDLQDHLDIHHIVVPPLLIQPFVENAIWHGLLRKKGPKTLVVSVRAIADALHITIVDNGIGRQAAPQKQTDNSPSRGIAITSLRLQQFQHSAFDSNVDIEDLFDSNNLPSGTRVNVCMPLKTIDTKAL